MIARKDQSIVGITTIGKLQKLEPNHGPQTETPPQCQHSQSRIYPTDPTPGGSGGPGKCGPPNDSADPAHTTATDDSDDGRNLEITEVKQQTDIIFNYSNVKLSDDMQKVLNQALNFA